MSIEVGDTPMAIRWAEKIISDELAEDRKPPTAVIVIVINDDPQGNLTTEYSLRTGAHHTRAGALEAVKMADRLTNIIRSIGREPGSQIVVDTTPSKVKT